MKPILPLIALLLLSIPCVILPAEEVQESSVESAERQGAATDIVQATTVNEARLRARLLHETIRGTLQIMHRDFFDEEDALAIPSASLEDVFGELSRVYRIDLKWLVVDTDVVNVDHQPKGDFERQAAKALAAGKKQFESTDPSGGAKQRRYRYAGPIRLHSQCLKCHVKHRISTRERVAGLAISIPIEIEAADSSEARH